MAMQNKERMLHFDVSLGCTSETIIAALAAVNRDPDFAKGALELSTIDTPERTTVLATLHRRSNLRRPAWARPYKKDSSQKSADAPQPSELGAWLRGETGTLVDVEKELRQKEEDPIALAIAAKVLSTLKIALEKSSGLPVESALLPGSECARILGSTLAFSELIAAMSPSAITASRIAMSMSDDLDNFKRGWMLALAEDLPTFDRLWPAPYSDYLGLAFLKAVVSRFGARGESVIDGHGTGQTTPDVSPQATTRALLCSLPRISSLVTEDAFAPPLPLVEITAILGQGINFPDVLRRLHAIGTTSVMTWQAFETSSFPRMMLRALTSHDSMDTVIEILLVTGEASELTTTNVESPALSQRVVSVPYGHRQKMQGCRVNEWLWAGKVIRVDPDVSDLAQIAQETGFAQEVVRADVLAAWRKWRAQA